jgi:cytochrome c
MTAFRWNFLQVRRRVSIRATLIRLVASLCILTGVSGGAFAQDFFTLKGHGGPIKGIDTGKDGVIVTASFDNSVGLWRNRTVTWLEGHSAAVNAVVYVGNGRLVSGGDDFSVRLWDSATQTSRVLGHHAGKVLRLAVSPDGTRVASASWDGSARIWSLDGDTAPVDITGHSNGVNDVAFSADGTELFSASTDGTLRVWDAATGAQRRVLVRHGFGINTLVLGDADQWIAYGAVDGSTRVVALPQGGVMHDFTLDRRPILAMAYNAERAQIAVGDAQGYIMMIDTTLWQISNDFRATVSGPIWALAFSPDGENINAGGLDDAMYSWPVDGFGAAPQMADTQRSFLTPPEEMSNGERQFQRKCSICHALGPDSERRAGPTLFRVFGRPAGDVVGYPYSDTLETSDIIWSEDTIEALFEQGPDHYIPGSKMPMQRITGPDDRTDLIAYLKTATAQD